jgi:hypothetical protein
LAARTTSAHERKPLSQSPGWKPEDTAAKDGCRYQHTGFNTILATIKSAVAWRISLVYLELDE